MAKNKPTIPEGQGKAEGFEQISELSRLENLERDVKIAKQLVGEVKNINYLIIIVLFIAIIAIIISYLYSNTQALSNNTDARIEQINEINQLQHDMNDLKQKTLPTPTLIPSVSQLPSQAR